MKLELGFFEGDMKKLRRAQDLLSQARARPVTLEELILEMTGEYLHKHDPIQKAQRIHLKKGTQQPKSVVATKQTPTQSLPRSLPKTPPQSLSDPLKTYVSPTVRQTQSKTELLQDQDRQINKTRTPIPSAIKHQVHLRDQGRCAHQDPHGKRCNSSRWIEIHHKRPVSQGGTHDLNNLITLCSTHHDYWHEEMNA
jgi:hypothetical protein